MNRAQALLKCIQEIIEEKKVWGRENPKKKHKRLTNKQKNKAKAWAKRHGKAYPSLIANMWAAKNA